MGIVVLDWAEAEERTRGRMGDGAGPIGLIPVGS